MSDIRDTENKASLGIIEGKERIINFDLNAFVELENHFGAMSGVNEALNNPSMKDLRLIVWAGLIWQECEIDPITGEPIRYTITPFQVGRWITMHNMKDFTKILKSALGSAMPEPSDEATSIEGVPENKVTQLPQLNHASMASSEVTAAVPN